MKVQVLVAAMNQQDYSLLDDMNIQTDVIVGNQCDRNEIVSFDYRGHQAKYLSFAERGVGLNRNNTLMRAQGEILLFADEDMRYYDGYAERVCRAFARHPDADVLIFNIDEEEYDAAAQRCTITKCSRVNWFNYLRYGMVRVAVKRSAVKEHGIYFNQCFGGGTEHRHGEDSIFLSDCLRNHLKIYTAPESLAILRAGKQSTWNVGYDVQYLKDQGCLYRTITHRWWRFLCLQDAVRKAKLYEMPWYQAYGIMVKGNRKA